MCKQFEEVRKEQEEMGQNYRPVDDLRQRAVERKAQRIERQTARQAEKERREELTDAEKKEERRAKKKKKQEERKDARKNVAAAATEQAYKTLQTNPNVYVRLCADALIGKTKFGAFFDARDIYDSSLNPLAKCGLLDFLLEAIQCLFGGLTLEDALLIMVTKALQAMGIENFGILFAGLPIEEQQRLDELVKQNLAEAMARGQTRQESRATTVSQVNERVEGDDVDRQRSGPDSIDPNASINPFKNIKFVRPFEKQELIDKERSARVPGAYETSTVSGRQYEAESSNFGVRRNIGTVYPQESKQRAQLLKVIYQAIKPLLQMQ